VGFVAAFFERSSFIFPVQRDTPPYRIKSC
jgi:hypothetical protein